MAGDLGRTERKDHQRIIEPITTEERGRRRIIALDLETDGLEGEFILGAYSREGSDAVVFLQSLDQWIAHVRDYANQRSIWYCHGGSKFDFKYLIDQLMTMVDEGATISPIVRGTTEIIGYVIREGKKTYELRDSYALMPASLADISAKFAPAYVKLDIGLGNGITFDPANPQHREYLRRDVLGLKHSLIAFDALLMTAFNVRLQWSNAATAVRAWQRTISKPYTRTSDKCEAFSRRAYYGGMVYLRSTNKVQDAVALDVNAMYAHAMRQGVPTGSAGYTREEVHGYPGIYQIRASVPASIPMAFLPLRVDYRTIWPTGSFTTYCTSMEINEARRYGCQIDIIDGYVFDKIEPVFDLFVQLCETLEIPAKGTALGDTIKYLRNSLYGKFAIDTEQTEYLLARECPDDYSPVVDPYSRELTALDWLFYRMKEVEKSTMQPHWAAWITANARLYLVYLNRMLGFHNVVYCDTDSLHVPRAAFDQAVQAGKIVIGPQYGQLKLQNEYSYFRPVAPKQYYGLLRDGSEVVKVKGIPHDKAKLADLERVANGEKVSVNYRMQRSTMAMLKGESRATNATRSYTDLSSSPGWRRGEAGAVNPINVDTSR